MHISLFTGDYHFLLLKETLLVPVVALLVLLPGFGSALFVARRIRLNWAELVLFSWVGTVAIAVVAGMFAYALRLSLSLVVVVLAAAAVASVLYLGLTVYGRRWPGIQRSRSAFVMAGAAALLAAWERPWWGGTADTYYHLAAVRSLLVTGRPLVTDPFHGTLSRVLDPTSGILHTIQAAASKTMSVDPTLTYYGFTVCGALLVVLAFWLLAHTISASTRAATAATALWMVASWYLDFRTFAFPNKVALSLAFVAIALLVRLLVTPSLSLFVMFVLAGVGAFAMHLAAAELTLLAGGIVLLFVAVFRIVAHRQFPFSVLKRTAIALGLMMLASLPGLVVRLHALTGSSVVGDESFKYAGTQILDLPFGMRIVTPGGFSSGGPWLFWPTLLLAVLIGIEAWRRKDPRHVGAFALAIMPAFLLTNPVVTTLALRFSSYMTARLGELLRASPYLAIAWALARFRRGAGRLEIPTAAVASVLAVVVAVPSLLFTFVPGKGTWRRGAGYPIPVTKEWDYRRYWGPRELAELRRIVGDEYPVVVGHRETVYYLMGLQPVAVLGALETHSPAYIEVREGERRRKENDWFMSPAALVRHRQDYARKRMIRYVAIGDSVLERQAMEAMLGQPEMFRLVYSSPRLALLEIVPPPPERRLR